MTYDYRETADEIVIEKGIATREMWKTYEDGSQEYATYEDLAHALELRDKVPIVLDTDWDHRQPLTDARVAIGSATLRPCPEKKGLTAIYRLWKDKLPAWLLERIHRRDELPVSTFSFVQMEGSQQRHIMFDHLAILKDAQPRCPIERCGVGVYDATMPEPKDPEAKPKDAKEPAKEKEQPKPTEAPPISTPPPAEAPKNAMPLEAQRQIEELKTQLAKREAQIAEVRQPLVDFLSQRGYTAQELNPLSVPTLQRMARDATRVVTEALPGQTPAPTASTPKTLGEAREAEQQRHQKVMEQKAKDKWSKW